MSQKSISKFAIILLIVGLSFAMPRALVLANDIRQNDGDVVIIVRPSEDPIPGAPRSPFNTIIEAYYHEDTSCVYANLQNAGNCVNVVITNPTTGEFLEYEIPGAGTSGMPISGASGFWCISFSLADGSMYYGEFVL